MAPTPQEGDALYQKAVQPASLGRPASSTVGRVLFYAVILVVLGYLYVQVDHRLNAPERGYLVMFLAVAAAIQGVVLFGRRAGFRPMDLKQMDPKDLENLVDGLRPSPPGSGDPSVGVPPERHRISDLSELPPEVAADPRVQKLFEDAKALGGVTWVSTTRTKSEPAGSVSPVTRVNVVRVKSAQSSNRVLYALGALLFFLTFVLLVFALTGSRA